jgi:hypothetical protein
MSGAHGFRLSFFFAGIFRGHLAMTWPEPTGL